VLEEGFAVTDAPDEALNPVAGSHVYDVAPEAVRITPDTPDGGVTEIAGAGFTTTSVVYIIEGLQPSPVLLTVSEYVPATGEEVVGFCNDEVNPPGPVHDQAEALEEFAVSVRDVPAHTGPLLVAPEEDGTAFTVTEVV
jgi:hypothetical protein